MTTEEYNSYGNTLEEKIDAILTEMGIVKVTQ